ncbi:MAG TPA: STM3941 family protein [Chitinophagaceae bacterium]|nr:STM3941 family protein [Chitinophagaceae bacterium]
MNNTSHPIEIPLSKKKLILMLAGSLVFIAIGIWFVLKPPTITHSFFGHPATLLATGIASILFFGLCTVFIVRKLPEQKAGLVIDHLGITDHSSGVSAGQILWSDIEQLSVLEIHRQKLIMIEVKNPQDYIDRQSSGFKKKLMQMNWKMYGTPLSITSNTLQIPFDELLQVLSKRLEDSRS